MKKFLSAFVFSLFFFGQMFAQGDGYIVSQSLAKRITDKVLNSPVNSQFVVDYLRANSQEFKTLSQEAVILRIKNHDDQRVYADNLISQYFQDYGYGDMLYLQLKEGIGCTATEFLEMYLRYKERIDASSHLRNTDNSSISQTIISYSEDRVFAINELTKTPRLNLDNLFFYELYSGEDIFEFHSDKQPRCVRMILHKDGTLGLVSESDTLSWTPFVKDVVYHIIEFGQYGFVSQVGYVGSTPVDCVIDLYLRERTGSGIRHNEKGPSEIRATVVKDNRSGRWVLSYPYHVDGEEYGFNSESEFDPFLEDVINKKFLLNKTLKEQSVNLTYYNRYLEITIPGGESKSFYFGL